MKPTITITIILFILLNGCLGQYPDVRYYGQKDSPLTRYKGNDVDTGVIYSTDGVLKVQWYNDTIPVTEASFYYWKQYLFYSHQKDIELDKIRKQRNPSYKEYDRLMDSVVRYKKLIDGLNK